MKPPDIRGSHLIGLHLEGINLNVHGSLRLILNFAGADLTRANLSNTDLADAASLNANLQGARLNGATVTRADFRGANFAGADLRQVKRGI